MQELVMLSDMCRELLHWPRWNSGNFTCEGNGSVRGKACHQLKWSFAVVLSLLCLSLYYSFGSWSPGSMSAKQKTPNDSDGEWSRWFNHVSSNSSRHPGKKNSNPWQLPFPPAKKPWPTWDCGRLQSRQDAWHWSVWTCQAWCLGMWKMLPIGKLGKTIHRATAKRRF